MTKQLKAVFCVAALVMSVGCATGPDRVETKPEKASAGCKCKAAWSEAPPAPGEVTQEEIKDSEAAP